jgi:orotidine-5'-phosphate decarboxylase
VQPPGTTLGPSFVDRFLEAGRTFGPLVFGLDPSEEILRRWGLDDTPDGLERFVDVVVEAAVGAVGLVKPQSAFYERHGWKRMRALARLAGECRAAGLLVVLDAKRGDVGSTNAAYGEAYLGEDAGIPVDALTLNPFLGLAAMRNIIERAKSARGAVFVVARSSNVEGQLLQEAVTVDGERVVQALLTELGAENARLSPTQVGPAGAVIGVTADLPPRVDLRAARALLLAPGLGTQGGTTDALARAFHSCPERVLPSASRSLLEHGPSINALRGALLQLADDVRTSLDAVRWR